MTSMLLALLATPAILGSSEAIRQGQTQDRREEHRARRCNLLVTCVDVSDYSGEIDHCQIALEGGRLWIKTNRALKTMHPFEGYYLPYPDVEYEGLVSTITPVAPVMNWIYVDRLTHQVRYGIRKDAQDQINGPFDCTRQDRRLTLEGWEGFVVVPEKVVDEQGRGSIRWGLYFDVDDDGLVGKLGEGKIVLEVELQRWEKRVRKMGDMRDPQLSRGQS